MPGLTFSTFILSLLDAFQACLNLLGPLSTVRCFLKVVGSTQSELTPLSTIYQFNLTIQLYHVKLSVCVSAGALIDQDN